MADNEDFQTSTTLQLNLTYASSTDLLLYMLQNNTFVHYDRHEFWTSQWHVPVASDSELYKIIQRDESYKKYTSFILSHVPFPYLFDNALNENAYCWHQITSTYLCMKFTSWHRNETTVCEAEQIRRKNHEEILKKFVYHYGSFHQKIKERIQTFYKDLVHPNMHHQFETEFFGNLIHGHDRLLKSRAEMKDILMTVNPLPPELNQIIVEFAVSVVLAE